MCEVCKDGDRVCAWRRQGDSMCGVLVGEAEVQEAWRGGDGEESGLIEEESGGGGGGAKRQPEEEGEDGVGAKREWREDEWADRVDASRGAP